MSNLQCILHHVTHCILLLFCSVFGSSTFAEDIFRAQGEMAGEVSLNSAIIQTRLTSVDRNIDGDVPGAAGVARFESATSKSFEQSHLTPWNSSRVEADYIVKAVLRDLKPGTRYYYRVHYGANRENTQTGPTCSFRTLQGAAGTEDASFVVVTGMMYDVFHGTDRKEKGPRPDRAAGYPALKTMLDIDLDFFVGTGDNVYYDTRPRPSFAKSLAELRQSGTSNLCSRAMWNSFETSRPIGKRTITVTAMTTATARAIANRQTNWVLPLSANRCRSLILLIRKPQRTARIG